MASASRFLPPGFDPTQAVAVIAGKGRYPALLIECARARGAQVKLVSFEEETDPALVAAFAPADHRAIPVGKLGQMLDALKELGAAGAVMAGQITPRKLFTGMVPDLKLIALMASLRERNAETIFGAISVEIEKIGVRMLDARLFLDDHLATPGQFLDFLETNWFAALDAAGVPAGVAAQLEDSFSDLPSPELFPGMAAVVERLAAAHTVLVITSSRTDDVERILEEHGVRGVAEVIGGDQEASKTHRIRAARERFGRARPAWYVGDTVGDILEAREAGVCTVGAAWGWHGPERLGRVCEIHLVGFSVAKLRWTFGGFPERPVKRRRKLCGIAHDRRVRVTGLVERRANRRHTPVHHVARRNDVRTGRRVRHRRFGQ